MSSLIRYGMLAALTGLAVVGMFGCEDDDDVMNPTTLEPMFTRYVAIGNSITAGVQSGGINDSTQLEAFPAIVSAQMGLTVGTDFVLPLFAKPGCAPPIENIFTLQRVGGGSGSDCGGLIGAAGVVHNVAVPGAKVIDGLSTTDPRSTPNPIASLIVGSQTQLDAAEAIQPTFVTVWLGANDVLGAALTGDINLITPLDVFESDFQALATRLDDMEVQGALLIGVPQVLNIPNLSPGAAYWFAAQIAALPPTLTVAANCADTQNGGAGETTLVPFGYGFGSLIAQATMGTAVTLDCVSDPEVVNTIEIVTIIGAIARFNTIIQRETQRRG